MLCYTAEGYLMTHSGSGGMQVESGFMKVIKWDASELLMEDSAQCRVSTISVNLKSKDVLMITRNKGTECDSVVPVEQLKTPRISRLVDGFRSNQELNRVKVEEAQKGFSKRWQEIAKTLKD
jgi:hypothetical protein